MKTTKGMEILNTEIKQSNKGTQYESKSLVVTITDACDYQGQFIDAIILVHRKNRDLNLDYYFAENTKENIYKLYFSIK